MNPWGFLVILLGILIIIMGIKGTQHEVAAAITGHGTPASALIPSGSSGTSGGTAGSTGGKNQAPA